MSLAKRVELPEHAIRLLLFQREQARQDAEARCSVCLKRGHEMESNGIDKQKVAVVVRKVRTLMKLTEMTGTITKRSQGLLLQSLSPEELLLAAEILTEGQAHATTNNR